MDVSKLTLGVTVPALSLSWHWLTAATPPDYPARLEPSFDPGEGRDRP